MKNKNEADKIAEEMKKFVKGEGQALSGTFVPGKKDKLCDY